MWCWWDWDVRWSVLVCVGSSGVGVVTSLVSLLWVGESCERVWVGESLEDAMLGQANRLLSQTPIPILPLLSWILAVVEADSLDAINTDSLFHTDTNPPSLLFLLSTPPSRVTGKPVPRKPRAPSKAPSHTNSQSS